MLFALAAISGIAQAQPIDWSVTPLYKEGYRYSTLTAVTDSIQAGAVKVSDESSYNATLWRGSANSWTDLAPEGSGTSYVLGAGGDQQAGAIRFRATLWRGSRESRVDLGPGEARDTDGATQVGWTTGGTRASLWTGTPESLVILHPEGAYASMAHSVDRDQQVGFVEYRDPEARFEAAMWTGSAQSLVSLDPPGVSASEALSVSRGQQAGWVSIANEKHASIWHGTAESWIDLHPGGAFNSEIKATTGEYQVGYVNVTREYGYAALWNGTNQPFNLNTVLPSHYIQPAFNAIYQVGNTLYIGGSAINTNAQRVEGILLTGEIVPEPAALLALAPALLLLRNRKR